MTRLSDLLPPGTEAEWSCGHTGDAICARCYRALQQRANELAEQVLRLDEELSQMRELARGRVPRRQREV